MLDAQNILQLGWQTAFKTANPTATRKLQNVSSFKLTPDLQTRELEQKRGTLAPTHKTALDGYSSRATAENGDIDFEELNYWLEMLFGTVTQAARRLTRANTRARDERACSTRGNSAVGNPATSGRCRTRLSQASPWAER